MTSWDGVAVKLDAPAGVSWWMATNRRWVRPGTTLTSTRSEIWVPVFTPERSQSRALG